MSFARFPLRVSLALAACAVAQAQEPARSSFTTGFDYSTGKYGGDQSTDILSVMATGKTVTGRWSYALTIPYIRITGPGDVLPEVGSVRPSARRRSEQTQSGLGDMIVSIGCAILDDPDKLCLDLTAKFKLATADEEKGLGSGKSDRYIQMDLYQQFDRLTPFAAIGYRALGDPSGLVIKDGLYVNAGASYQLKSELSVGGMLDLREKTTPIGDNAMELTSFVTYHLSEKWRVQGYAVKGFTDASPDHGIGGMAIYTF